MATTASKTAALDSPLYAGRRRRNAIAKGLAFAATIFGLGWLILILGVLLYKGVGGLSLAVFTENTPPPGAAGGLLNAIMGSIMMTVLAVIIGTPSIRQQSVDRAMASAWPRSSAPMPG